MGPELRRFLPGENLLLFLPLRIKDESQRERERERPFQLVRLFYVLERLVVPLFCLNYQWQPSSHSSAVEWKT